MLLIVFITVLENNIMAWENREFPERKNKSFDSGSRGVLDKKNIQVLRRFYNTDLLK